MSLIFQPLFAAIKYLVVNLLNDKPVFSTIQYWLVKHPKIQNFTWRKGQTPGSSPLFLTFTVLSYLSFTFLLSNIRLPSISPRYLKSLTVIHNIILLTGSLIMAIGSDLSILYLVPDVDNLICFPKNTTPTGPLFFWAYVFYLSKIYEFMDTLLIILSNSMRRLSFLHVYHHATVVVMCYISLQTAQTMFPGVVHINALVHVFMYFYYFLCSIGIRPKWKKLVTDCQILQFFISLAIMALIFYHHFSGSGCSGIWGWYFDAVFITSLLVLFLDFHSKNYSKKITGKKSI